MYYSYLVLCVIICNHICYFLDKGIINIEYGSEIKDGNQCYLYEMGR